MKQAIRLLKYKNSKPLAAVFGSVVSDYLLEFLSDELLFQSDPQGLPWILVPLPLSKERLRTRGYNQATLIGQNSISQALIKVLVLDNTILYKRLETPSQVSIKDRKSRMANPKGSFTVFNRNRIYKRQIIVLDDVVTTGATLLEAMRVLKDAGAKNVLGISIAH